MNQHNKRILLACVKVVWLNDVSVNLSSERSAPLDLFGLLSDLPDS